MTSPFLGKFRRTHRCIHNLTVCDLYGTLGCVNDYGECVVRTIILLILILYTIHGNFGGVDFQKDI